MKRRTAPILLITFFLSNLIYAQVEMGNHQQLPDGRQIDNLKIQLNKDEQQLNSFHIKINELESACMTKNPELARQLKSNLVNEMHLTIEQNEKRIEVERRKVVQKPMDKTPNRDEIQKRRAYLQEEHLDERRADLEKNNDGQRPTGRPTEPREVHSRNPNPDLIPPEDSLIERRLKSNGRNTEHRPIDKAPKVDDGHERRPNLGAPEEDLGDRNSLKDTAIVRRGEMMERQKNRETINKQMARIAEQRKIQNTIKEYTFSCTPETAMKDRTSLGLLNEFAHSMEEGIMDLKKEIVDQERKIRESRENLKDRRPPQIELPHNE